jgi:hypothetical protein
VELAAGIAQQLGQVVQTSDVFAPERLSGEGDRPVFALTAAHRPRGSVSGVLGRRQRRRARWPSPAARARSSAARCSKTVIPSRLAVSSAASTSPAARFRSPGWSRVTSTVARSAWVRAAQGRFHRVHDQAAIGQQWQGRRLTAGSSLPFIAGEQLFPARLRHPPEPGGVGPHRQQRAARLERRSSCTASTVPFASSPGCSPAP